MVIFREIKRKLRIKALPTNLPDNIEIDISELNIGDKVYITELFNENYEFLHPDNTVVCQVRRARAALVVETEEGEGEEGEEGAEEGSEGTSKKILKALKEKNLQKLKKISLQMLN